MAYNESHANTFVASIDGAHRLLGFIHAMYALGTLVSPFVATAVVTKVPEQWPFFYLYLVGIGTINAIIVAYTFRDSLRSHAKPPTSEGEDVTSRSKTANRDIIATLKSPPVYLLSMFYFFMLGTGITAGGWVVEYLVQARNGHLPDVGYVPAALWGGIFVGRIVLAEPTHRFGERRMTFAYCILILIFQLVFWLVPNLITSAVSLCLLGVFYGPMFATVSPPNNCMQRSEADVSRECQSVRNCFQKICSRLRLVSSSSLRKLVVLSFLPSRVSLRVRLASRSCSLFWSDLLLHWAFLGS
jgi:fucose permease